MSAEIYQQIRDQAAQGEIESALRLAADQFRSAQSHAELFEVLKMRARYRAGLPLLATGESWCEVSRDPAPDEQACLEHALYGACEEVGEMLFRAGRPALAWRYFQLVGNRSKAAQLLRAVPVTDEILSELIQVAVDASVDPEYGLELTIQHRGICNAITMVDGPWSYAPRATREAGAALLVTALHVDLVRALKRDIQGSDEHPWSESDDVAGLLAERPELCGEGRVHLDVSHLSAVVRLAKVCRRRDIQEKAFQLCEYGTRIDVPWRGEGEPPFAEHFPDHRRYFAALLGDPNPGLRAFRDQAESDQLRDDQRRNAWEVVGAIHLAHHQFEQALEISIRSLQGAEGPLGLLPPALDLATRAGKLAELAQHYAGEDNLLLYAMATLSAMESGADSFRARKSD